MPGWFGARAKKLLEDDDNDAGGYMPVIAEAVPRPPDGRDINASISPGERKGIWLLMVATGIVVTSTMMPMGLHTCAATKARRRQ